MLIKRESMLTGVEHVREIDVTHDQLDQWENQCVLIQDAMPDLSADDREFIMTGITPEEWDDAVSEK